MTHEIDTRLRALERAVVELVYDRYVQECRSENTTSQRPEWWSHARDQILAAIPDPDAAPAKRWWCVDRRPFACEIIANSFLEAREVEKRWDKCFAHHAPHLAIKAATADEAVAEYRRRVADDTWYRESVEGDLRGEIARLTEQVATLTRERDASRAACLGVMATLSGNMSPAAIARLTAAARGEVANG